MLAKLTLRNITQRKLRFLLTSLSVLLGVAFVVATFIVTDGLREEFDELAGDIAGNVDLTARPVLEFGDRDEIEPTMPRDLVDVVRGVDGVADAAPWVGIFGRIEPLDEEGEPLQSFGPSFGANWVDNPALSVYFLVDDGVSRAPMGPTEVVVEFETLKRFEFEIGQTINVEMPASGPQSYEIVGAANFADPEVSGNIGAQQFVWDTETAIAEFNLGLGIDSIAIDVEAGEDREAVLGRVQAALPEGIEVLTNDEIENEQAEEFATFITIFTTILLSFALVILFVSAFIIWNTFSIVVGQRIRELGLLRAIGATGKQVTRSVVLEALAVGIAATVLGILLGVPGALALRGLLSAFGGSLPDFAIQLPVRTILVAAFVGIGITVVFATFPAIKAGRIPPIAALRDGVRLSSNIRTRPVLGAVLFGVGVLAALGAFVGNWQGIPPLGVLAALLLYFGGSRIRFPIGRFAVAALGLISLLLAAFGGFGAAKQGVLLGIGAFLLIIGVSLISPLFASPVARAIGSPLPALSGVTGQMARQNAARSPRRTASTASALMIGLALVGTVSVLGASIKATFSSVLRDAVTADWFICEGNCVGGDPGSGFSPSLTADLNALPEIESLIAYRFKFEGLRLENGDVVPTQSADFALIDQHLDPVLVEGSFADGVDIPAVAIENDVADDLGYSLGDVIPLEFAGGPTLNVPIVAIYDDARILGQWSVNDVLWDEAFPLDLDQFVSANTTGDPAAARTAIEGVLGDYGDVNVYDGDEFRDNQASQVDDFLTVINVFLGMAILLALFGIANTLALSVFERTREIGLLRAVGQSRAQTRRMIIGEGFIVAVFGGLLGLLLGVLFGIVAVAVIPDDFVSDFAIPWGTMLVYLIVAGLAGVLAAALPAWRASRLNVLDAISTE